MGGAAEVGDGTRLYRRLRFGKLVELSMLDLRTYRSQQAARPRRARCRARPTTATARSPGGPDGLAQALAGRGGPLWKVVGNPVMIAPVTFANLPPTCVEPVHDTTGLLPPEGVPYNVDQWDGYTADRREVLSHMRDHGVLNAVFLTGDIHSGWACDVPDDASTYPLSDSAGTEFVCTCVTSQQPRRHHGLAATHHEHRGRGGHQDRQPPREVPQLRRPRLLRRRHHPAQAPGRLLHHQRPGRPRRRPNARIVGDAGQLPVARAPGRGDRRLMCAPEPGGAFGAAASRSGPPTLPARHRRSRRHDLSAALRRPRGDRDDARRGPTSSWWTAASPARSPRRSRPRSARLRARLNYPRAQSMPVMETIPNHVMMMTGVRPDRNHVPANTVYDRTTGEVRTLDRKRDLQFPTVIEPAEQGRVHHGHGAVQGVPLRDLR